MCLEFLLKVLLFCLEDFGPELLQEFRLFFLGILGILARIPPEISSSEFLRNSLRDPRGILPVVPSEICLLSFPGLLTEFPQESSGSRRTYSNLSDSSSRDYFSEVHHKKS